MNDTPKTSSAIIAESIAINGGMYAPPTAQRSADLAQGPMGGGRAAAAHNRARAIAHSVGQASAAAATQAANNAAAGCAPTRRRPR
jgi:hypothetical protein